MDDINEVFFSVSVSVTILMNVIRNPTRAASVTILDPRININISQACRTHQRTSPWILVRIPFRTESYYSWTNVDDLITWTLINNCVLEGSNISTLMKFFSTCNNTKMWVRLTLLSRYFQQDACCIIKYEKQVGQLSQTNRAAAWAIIDKNISAKSVRYGAKNILKCWTV